MKKVQEGMVDTYKDLSGWGNIFQKSGLSLLGDFMGKFISHICGSVVHVTLNPSQI